MRAAILAGGKGTRLQTVVNDRPKPMALVGESPFLEYLLHWLRAYGLTEVVFCVGYKWQAIYEYFRDGSQRGMHIEYSIEERPLGTGGALKNACNLFDSTFVALNGDSYLALDVRAMADFHSARGACATLAVSRVEDASSSGTVRFDQRGRVTGFVEKDSLAGHEVWANAGIYVLEPWTLDLLPADRASSVEYDLFPLLSQAGMPIYAHRAQSHFLDIGTPEGYFHAQTVIPGGTGDDSQS
ncbi:MAG TPA: sugar phosphate nucleotidyltransferase [Anaerolineae bacterium]